MGSVLLDIDLGFGQSGGMTLGATCWQLTGFVDEAAESIEAQLRFAKRIGLDGVDVRSAEGNNVTALSPAQLAQIKSLAGELDLAIACVGSPVNKVEAAPEHHAAQMDLLKRALDACHALGAPAIRIFSPSVKGEGRLEDWPLVQDWMSPQVEMAAGAGVVVLHENDGRYWGAYPACCRVLLEQFQGPLFGAIYDPSNAVLIGTRTMRDWLPWLLPHLRCLHVKDSIEEGARIVRAGEGEGEFPELMRFLAASGWRGGYAMEPHLHTAGAAGGFSGEKLFEGAVSALKRLFEEEA